jgi:predicted nucleic acid-binding protein
MGVFEAKAQSVKILIDTNIILDFALERQSFQQDSELVLLLAEQKQIEGYISASTVSDLYYILRKGKGRDWTLDS